MEPPTGHYGPEGVANFVYFGGGQETWGDSTCGIQFPVLLVTNSSRLFYTLERLHVFVFEPIGGVFVESFVGVGFL